MAWLLSQAKSTSCLSTDCSTFNQILTLRNYLCLRVCSHITRYVRGKYYCYYPRNLMVSLVHSHISFAVRSHRNPLPLYLINIHLSSFPPPSFIPCHDNLLFPSKKEQLLSSSKQAPTA